MLKANLIWKLKNDLLENGQMEDIYSWRKMNFWANLGFHNFLDG